MGAWTGVLALCMARDSSSDFKCFKCEFSVLFRAFLLRWQRAVARSGDAPQRRRRRSAVGGSVGGKRGCEATSGGLTLELFTHPKGRFRIGEEDRSERERRRTGGDQLEPMGPGFDPADSDDRQSGRAVGREDGGEGDRAQRRARETTDPWTELRLERSLVESETTDRVHEREPVRTGARRSSCGGPDIRDGGRELRVERFRGRRSGGRNDFLHLFLRRGNVRA